MQVASREDWTKARLALLEREKAHLRERDALAAARRALPRVPVTKTYRFAGPDGALSLEDLFAGKDQLAIYHFMFATGWEEGCTSCSFWADSLNGIEAHMAARDVSLVLVSAAPFERIDRYKSRMGWSLPWVSTEGSDFNRDFGVAFDAEAFAAGTHVYNYRQGGFPAPEAPGLSTFERGSDGGIYHVYSTYARGIDSLNAAYQLLDLTPRGRNEDDLPSTMAWLRRRDQY